jgi:hypothetical protein
VVEEPLQNLRPQTLPGPGLLVADLPYSASQRASASADMSASANILIIERSRSGLAEARLSSVRACRGTLSGAVIVLISFELRPVEM